MALGNVYIKDVLSSIPLQYFFRQRDNGTAVRQYPRSPDSFTPPASGKTTVARLKFNDVAYVTTFKIAVKDFGIIGAYSRREEEGREELKFRTVFRPTISQSSSACR